MGKKRKIKRNNNKVNYILPYVHRLWSRIFKEHQVSCQKRTISYCICFSSLLHSKSYEIPKQSLVFHVQVLFIFNELKIIINSSSSSNDHYNYDNINHIYCIIA
jgi:hypothetical protein